MLKEAAYAVLGAHLLHELTHYVIALVLLRNPSFGIFGIRESGIGRYIGTLHVDHDAYPYVTLGDFAIHVGPTVIGALAALWWILVGAPAPEVWMVVGWFVYTLLGLPNDVRFRVVDDESTV